MTTATDWTGRVGDVWAAEWRRTDRSFADLSRHLDATVVAAAPASGIAVDLGCGAGQTSLSLAAARPGLTITGVDLSPELIRIATERVGKATNNLRFAVADVATDADRIAAGADLLFSRHGVMFFDRPYTVFADLHAAAAPGARLVFSCFRARSLNPWAGKLIRTVTGTSPAEPAGYAPGPFGFADADWTRAMLSAAGWQDMSAQPVDFTYITGGSIDPVADAADFFRRIGPVSAALAAASGAERPAMLDRLSAALADHRQGNAVSFSAAAWLWTARKRILG